VPAAPAIGESVIAVGSVDRNIVLLDRATGRSSGARTCRARCTAVRCSTPIDVRRDRSDARGKGRGLRLRDGRIMWSRKTGKRGGAAGVRRAPSCSRTEVASSCGSIPNQGAVAWRRQLSGAIRAAPVVTPDGLVIATTNDTLLPARPRHGRDHRGSGATPGRCSRARVRPASGCTPHDRGHISRSTCRR